MYGAGCGCWLMASRDGAAASFMAPRSTEEVSLLATRGEGRCRVGGDIIRGD